MAVETSPPPDGTPRGSTALPLDPVKLTQAYRRSSAVVVPEATPGRRSPLVSSSTHNMPPISCLQSKVSMDDPGRFLMTGKPLRRDLQRVLRDEAERGAQRPPTPARPSLPQLDQSFSGVSRGSRSRSEPRTSADGGADQHSDQMGELLDSSVRSDGSGWRSVRGRPQRDDSSNTVTGTTRSPPALSLPPIGGSGKQTPVHRMTRQETQRLLAAAKLNLQAMEAGKTTAPAVATPAMTSSSP